MRNRTQTGADEQKTVAYSKVDVIKLDTKCLYAGKLERIKQWNEKPHSHPFCEILFVFSGKGETCIDDKTYTVSKGDLLIYNPNSVHWERTLGDPGLELGYYLIDSTMGALCGLTTTNPDASINAKNSAFIR